MRKPFLAAAALMLATTANVWAQPGTTEGTPTVKQPDTTSMQIRARETMQDIKQYSAAQKDQALAKAREGMASLDRRIDQAQTNINEGWKDMSQDARLKKQTALGNLKDDREALQAQYEALKAASADSWEQAKGRFGDAWDSTTRAWHQLTTPDSN